ncbi:MAG: apiosidase-like domain-containing protein, partial [Myxococcales bacterium]
VFATNGLGDGPSSAASAPVIPASPGQTVPGAPTGVAAVGGDAQATVQWTPPANNGGSAITAYTVSSNPGDLRASVGGTVTTATVAGLANGTSYTFTVFATNAVGDGPSSAASAPVIPASAGQTVFPVTYSSSRRYLQDQSGAPFPILGRTAWFVTSLSSADYKTFIDDSVSKGFNAIEFHVVNHDDRGNRAPYGNNGTLLPFLKRLDGGSWTGSISYGNPASEAPDFTTPNEAYWSFVDGLLDYALSKGVLCFMFPAYWGYGGGQQGWGMEITANGAAKMGSYGTWIGTRYQNQPNLVWMAGGDYGNSGASFSSSETTIEKAMLDGIDGVPGKLSTYWAAEWSFGQSIDQRDFGSRMTLNGIYNWGGGQTVYRQGWLYTPTEPAFNLESPYDQEGPDGLNWNPNATQPVRRFLWWSILGTIGGYITGNGYVWTFTTGWQNHLNTQGAQDLARLNAFYTSIAWQRLVPTNLGGSRNLIVAGGSTDGSADWVAAAADPAGSVLVAYIPPAHSGSITVDMTALAGTAQARWFDPTTGVYMTVGSFPNTGTQSFTPPGANGTGAADWTLVITVP